MTKLGELLKLMDELRSLRDELEAMPREYYRKGMSDKELQAFDEQNAGIKVTEARIQQLEDTEI
jgi:hypothetical protein